MIRIILLLSVLLVNTNVCNGFGRRLLQDMSDCEYSSLSSTHTMCLTDVGSEIVVTEAMETAVVNAHNDYRKDVSPTASQMVKVIYDDELGNIASKWARQCVVGHDSHSDRKTKAYPEISIGQNGAFRGSDGSWPVIVKAWYDEITTGAFEYGTGSTNNGTIGHFTQVVNDDVVRIGCGSANCSAVNTKYQKFMMCNYARGQRTSESTQPYTSGTPCTDCLNCDSNKLCHCDGRICRNGGTMNYKDCTCTCPELFTGTNCDEANCYPDKSHCHLYKDEYCKQFSNVPEECPHKCGLC